MAKMGRPKKKFDVNEFEKLCGLMCTEEEIADWFNFSVDTLERRCKEIYGCTFAEIYRQKKVKGHIALRRSALHLAKKNAAMCIFLLKNHLGFRDNIEIEEKGGVKIAIDWGGLDDGDSVGNGEG